MDKTEKLTEQYKALYTAVRKFVKACPDFEGGSDLVKDIAVASANVETTLHYEFGCWELGLPGDEWRRFE